MDKIEQAKLHDLVTSMSREQRLHLDPICEAIDVYRKIYDCKGWRYLTNRIGALAAVHQVEKIEQLIMEGD